LALNRRHKAPSPNQGGGHARLGRDVSDHRADRGGAGFGGIASFAVGIAKIVFVVAIILFLISAVVGIARGRSPML
jgi:uncharacterized membrane protein YtjA (UPF0391 family)